MSDYALTGKKGTGKSSGAVLQIKQGLAKGRRVATNLNLYLDKLTHLHSRRTVIRLPDKPKASDLISIGSGNPKIQFDVAIDQKTGLPVVVGEPRLLPGFDEAENGLLVLDEMASWMNSRSFQDKDRLPTLEWLIHARKYGWDVYYIMQNIKQVDAQVRESLLEYVVRFHRLDKIKIPGVSSAIKLMTAGQSEGTLPKFHVGVMRLGIDPNGLVADRWTFTGKGIHAAYDTTQVFQDNYPHGTFCYLPHWHLAGYAVPEKEPIGWRVVNALRGLVKPKVCQWHIKNRRLLQLMWHREKNPQKRQKLLEAIYRQEQAQKRVQARQGASARRSGADGLSLAEQARIVAQAMRSNKTASGAG